MISVRAERLYSEHRKAPYNFDTFEEYTAFDDKLRAETRELAIKEIDDE